MRSPKRHCELRIAGCGLPPASGLTKSRLAVRRCRTYAAGSASSGALVTVLLFVGLALFLWSAIDWSRFAVSADGLRALLINFLFFSPLTAGMVVWPAVVMLSHGRWSGAADRAALAAWTFAPVSFLMLVGLWAGQAQWTPWAARPSEFHQGLWLAPTFVFARNVAALVIFWAVAAVFIRRRQTSRPSKLGAALAITYALVFSLMGFDFVMSLDPRWYSTLFGGYFFISGMYAAMTAWVLSAALAHVGVTPSRLHDMGKLVVAFSILTAYLMYSQLLPIWYENLPQEIRFLTPRLNLGNWLYVGLGLLFVVYLGPLVMLLTVRAKKNVAVLGAVCTLVLVGLWVERWYLVTPTLNALPGAKTAPPMTLGLSELSLAVALTAALVLCIRRGLRTVPTIYEEAPAE